MGTGPLGEGEGEGGGVGVGDEDGLVDESGVGEAAGNPPMANAPTAKTTIAATPMTRPSGPVRRRPGRVPTVARGLGRRVAGPRAGRRRFGTHRWYALPLRRNWQGLLWSGPCSRSVREGTGAGGLVRWGEDR